MPYRYFIKLGYNGTRYHGWQIQPGASTVQETLNKNLSILLKESIYTIGAGRTDTGVHAPCFYAHFDSGNELQMGNITEFIYHLNCILPNDIVVFDIFRVSSDAHARFSAISRTYLYRIARTKNPFTNDVAWYYHKPLDINKMNEACSILFNYIDFTSFSKLHTDVKTNNCKILKAFWSETDNEIQFNIQADRFLRNMVRAIVGTLIKVGSGQLNLAGFSEVIEKKDRSAAGISVEAKGLHLIEIEYPVGIYAKF